MRVLYITAEVYPWVKSGGLGDVAAALPPALTAQGVDVRLLLPGFRGFLDAFPGITDVARLEAPFAAERVRLGLARLPGSESLAYPLCLLAMWTMLRAVRCPSIANDALLLAAIVLACAARLQLVALVPAALTAVLLVALARPEPAQGRLLHSRTARLTADR